MDQIEKLKNLHYTIRDLLNDQKFVQVKKIMSDAIGRLDVNELKTIEIITRSFKDHPEMTEGYNAVKVVFDSAMKLFDTMNNQNKL